MGAAAEEYRQHKTTKVFFKRSLASQQDLRDYQLLNAKSESDTGGAI